MTPRRLRLAAASGLCLSAAMMLLGCVPEPAPTPTVTRAPSASASPTRTPTPTPTRTPTALSFSSCEDMVTDEYRATAAGRGWSTWMLPADQGVAAFAAFPADVAAAALRCRWGAAPDAADAVDLSWAALASVDAGPVQAALASQGYERINSPDGTYLARPQQGAYDGDVFGEAYLFTDADVRWAMRIGDLRSIRRADAVG